MPDSDKAFWETVQKKAPDKLHSRDSDRFCPLFLSVLGGEGDHTVFKFFDAAVGNGHPVSIACQVFEDMFRALDRLAYTDHPVFCIQHFFEVTVSSACKFECTGFADMLKALHELTAKDP